MFSKWFLIGILVAVCGTVVSQREFLDQFHEEFTYYANNTKVELQTMREWNSGLIREFNRELLLVFGRLIPVMRTEAAEFLELILNYESVSEECREEVLYLRDAFVFLQNLDIRDCAFYAYLSVSFDSYYRFWPYHNPFVRQTVKAISQVVETLGRRSPYDLVGIEAELQEESDYFRNLREGQLLILGDELAAHADAADEAYRDLEECRQWAEGLQQDDQAYILTYLDSNCEGTGTTTEGPITTTTEGPETTTDEAETTTEGSETTEGPETTTVGAETTTEDPETTEGPETTTDGAETTTEDPETTEGPETTTDESETTTEGSETTEGPETTTDEPETTEGAETTDGPETTTDEPETTEGSDTTEDPEVTTDGTETPEVTEAL